MRCFFILFFIPIFLNAQVKKYDLSGVITVKDSGPLSFKLAFTDSNGIIYGYSITDIGKINETKAAIKGTIDKKGKRLNFKETKIIYTHAIAGDTAMCFVSAELKYKKLGDNQVLSGNFTGRKKDNTICATGNIAMLNTDKMEELFKTIVKADTTGVLKKPVEEKMNTPIPLARDTFATTDEVTVGIELIYRWTTDTLGIEIWDGGKMDYDMVTLMLNDKTLLSKYTLKQEKMKLMVPLSGKSIDDLVIIAENEGSEPPNTANLILSDGNRKYNVVAHNERGRHAVIKIKKMSK